MSTEISSPAPRQYRYYDLVMAAFVTVLLCSNIIGPGKVCQVELAGHPFTFGAGILFFPISYLFDDILTEVYGYARSRKMVWAGFGALLFASLMSWAIVGLPAAPEFHDQAAYARIFGATPRIVLGSLAAFWTGEFLNSYVLAKLKVKTEGRFLFARFIGSTVVGEGVDTLIFYPCAFFGLWDTSTLLAVMAGNYTIKILWEVLATPLTYAVCGYLKRAENEDHFDRDTDFTPFSLQL
jgi:queuosine precursor transporter